SLRRARRFDRAFGCVLCDASMFRRSACRVLAVTVLAGAAHVRAADQAASDPVAALLAQRHDRASTAPVIAALAGLTSDPARGVAAEAALLQARYFRADQYLHGKEKVAAQRENADDGLRRLAKRTGMSLSSFDDLEAQVRRVPKAHSGIV